MNRLRSFLLSFTFMFAFACSSVSGEKQFNYGWHQTDFIEGNCKIETKDFNRENVSLWTIEFTDGCLAGFMSDLSGANQRNFRWINRYRHGKLMTDKKLF